MKPQSGCACSSGSTSSVDQKVKRWLEEPKVLKPVCKQEILDKLSKEIHMAKNALRMLQSRILSTYALIAHGEDSELQQLLDAVNMEATVISRSIDEMQALRAVAERTERAKKICRYQDLVFCKGLQIKGTAETAYKRLENFISERSYSIRPISLPPLKVGVQANEHAQTAERDTQNIPILKLAPSAGTQFFPPMCLSFADSSGTMDL